MTRRDRCDVSAGRGSLRTVAAGGGVDRRRNEGTVSAEISARGVKLCAAVAERGAAPGAAPGAAIGATRGAAAFSFATGLDGGLDVGCELATGGDTAAVRCDVAVEVSGGALTGVAVRGVAGGAARGAAGVRVRCGIAAFAAGVSRVTLVAGIGGTSAFTSGARRRTGFAGVDGVGVSWLAPADSVAGLRLRGGFGGSGSSMHEV
jgi:hypothetical protein